MSPDDIREWERVGRRAIPAAEAIDVGGWTLLSHGGPWRRANSVQTTEDPGDDVAALAARCDALYRARGTRTIFKLTPASRPDGLDAQLASLGYVREAPTRVMTRGVSRVDLVPPDADDRPAGPADSADSPDSGVRLAPDLPSDWLDAMLADRPDLVAHADELRALLVEIEPDRRFAVVSEAERPVAIGLAVLDGDRLGLFDLLTAPDRRGRGIGSRVVERLIDWGVRAGARTAWLQVEEENVLARRLYARLAFRDAYPYWYRVS